MRFSFIHAADLHIDSPLAALSRKNAGAAETFKHASRRALEKLVEHAIASEAPFLIIAGDIFDGDWQDVSTGLFFTAQLGRLERAGVRVFMLRGNHDFASGMSHGLRWPDNVHEFPGDQAQTIVLDELGVALHGRSFADRLVGADFVITYPRRREGLLNIGVLHTALDGRGGGHEKYAPCDIETLRTFGYDYWALGHIHAHEIVTRDPWIVFPGNLQGRSVRETGPRGVMRVDVEDGRIVHVERIILDAARWAHERVDISACQNRYDALDALRQAAAEAHANAGALPLAIRITLTGASPLHDELLAHAESFEDQARGEFLRIAQDCWLEKLRFETIAPTVASSLPHALADDLELKSFDLQSLLADAAADPAFATSLQELIADVASRMPEGLRGELDDPQTLAARAPHLLAGLLRTGNSTDGMRE